MIDSVLFVLSYFALDLKFIILRSEVAAGGLVVILVLIVNRPALIVLTIN